MRRHSNKLRDSLLFLAGLYGVVHEVTSNGVERPFLLLVLSSMIGVPVASSLDAILGRNRPDDEADK